MKKRTNWMQLASFALIVLLTTEIVLLIIQNRELKATIKSYAAGPREPLKAGDKVESVKVQTLDGSTTDLQYTDPGQKYLLLVFSTTCPHCAKTLPLWNSLVEEAKDKPGLNVMGISSESLEILKPYVADKKPGFYVVSVADDTSFSRRYKIPGVPETILVKGDGTVIKAWVGELQPGQVEEIQNLLKPSSAGFRGCPLRRARPVHATCPGQSVQYGYLCGCM
ncbi:MAG: TlpA family protein disulfide reductase [Ignavibacteriae bacterium]|nr:TlpA family protein disulfide reductase [Ignavibacteriota bacterium]